MPALQAMATMSFVSCVVILFFSFLFYPIALVRDQNGINHVNDTVFCGDVRLGDRGVINGDDTIRNLDVEFLAVDGLGHHGLHVSGHDFGGHNVIGQDAGEFGLVLWLEQVFQSAFGQLGKGCIRRREDGKRAGSFQGFNQSSGFDRLDEGGAIFRTGSNVNNVFGGGVGIRVGVAAASSSYGERDHRDETIHFHSGILSFCFLFPRLTWVKRFEPGDKFRYGV